MDTKPNKVDYGVALTKGVAGAFPFVGPLVAEAVGTFIPDQRLDRIAKFLEILDKKVAELDQEQVKLKFSNPEFVDLLEDSFYQAARALTDERKEYIASIIKNGLSDEQFEHIRYKRMLSLLSELNDIEVIILRGHHVMDSREETEKFYRKHQNVIMEPIVEMGASKEARDKQIIYKTHKSNLVKLELLKPSFINLKKGELPEFDKNTGAFKTNSHHITPLGSLLLRHIDLIE